MPTELAATGLAKFIGYIITAILSALAGLIGPTAWFMSWKKQKDQIDEENLKKVHSLEKKVEIQGMKIESLEAHFQDIKTLLSNMSAEVTEINTQLRISNAEKEWESKRRELKGE